MTLRQLALDRPLPPATALREVASRRDVANPDKERDKSQCTGCQHRDETRDQPADDGAHQSHDAQLDAVDPIGIHAGLDQINRIEARRTKVQAAAPQNGNGSEPPLVPSLLPLLMLSPLDWRERRGADQVDRR